MVAVVAAVGMDCIVVDMAVDSFVGIAACIEVVLVFDYFEATMTYYSNYFVGYHRTYL